MKNKLKEVAGMLAIAVLLFTCACSEQVSKQQVTVPEPTAEAQTYAQPEVSPTPAFPNLQSELLDDRNKDTTAPIGQFDFKNFSYPLPRGWQHPDGSDLILKDGRLVPVSVDIGEEINPEDKAALKAERRIGMSYVTTIFLDATGDGQDDAVVILKVETTGAAIPQLVYIYNWKEGKPELIWYFRTGDRADGGLKDLRMENNELVVKLYGQDRFLLGETETGKITGDEEQLCCPTYFTRTSYKWNGRNFLMQKKRLTYSIADPSEPPVDKLGDIVNNPKMQKPARK